MKKLMMALTALSLLGSCAKKDKEERLVNAWKLSVPTFRSTETYTMSGNTRDVSTDATLYSFKSADGHLLTFHFTETPADGDYKVQEDVNLLKKGEVFITEINSNKRSVLFAYSGAVRVKIAGDGKLNLSCNDVAVTQVDSLAYSAVTYVALSANVTEQ